MNVLFSIVTDLQNTKQEIVENRDEVMSSVIIPKGTIATKVLMKIFILAAKGYLQFRL